MVCVFVLYSVLYVLAGMGSRRNASSSTHTPTEYDPENDKCATSTVHKGYDLQAGKVLAGVKPDYINSSNIADCCARCENYAGNQKCTTWVREPSTGHCWLIAGGTLGTKTKEDRTIGFIEPTPISKRPFVYVEAFGNDSLRIRITYADSPLTNIPGAVLPLQRGAPMKWTWGSPITNSLSNGNIAASVTATGKLNVTRPSDGAVIFNAISLTIEPTENPDYFAWALSTVTTTHELVWGLGEHVTGQVNNRGLNFDFKSNQKNTHVTIPFAVSSKRYGVFFNNPGWGGIDLSNTNSTTWSASVSTQLDFIVMTHSRASVADPYPDILERYYDAIGHPPVLPDWAMGFWASKQRYSSQTEIIDVVRNYSTHNITVDVLVIDWKHYSCVGDWGFTLNPSVCWANPTEMVTTLKSLGVQQVFVSVHPWSEPHSDTYDMMTAQGLCAQNNNGSMVQWGGWGLPTCNSTATYFNGDYTFTGDHCLYDVSNPAARRFLWNRLKQSYYDAGIHNFWTDGTEPAGAPKNDLPSDMLFYSDETGKLEWPSPSAFMYWPVWHSQTIHEGAQSAGSNGTWSLVRSAWAGSHLRNTIVWSGDIGSDWNTLQNQVKAGLNMQLVFPYWNTDTAGFGGGDWQEMGQLMVRWMQFSIFTGILRVHGSRTPKEPDLIPLDTQCDPTASAGGPIEPWVYGPDTKTNFEAIKAAIDLRRTMLPYMKEQVQLLATKGQPFMRPAWYDFPHDPAAEGIEDAFMFGPDFYVAPVLVADATNRTVVFPAARSDVKFQDFFTGEEFKPGPAIVQLGPIDTFPLYKVVRN